MITIKYIKLIFAFMIIAIGVSLVINVSSVGLEPWQAVHLGIAKLGLTIGLWTILLQFIFIILTILIEKRPPKIGTFLNMICIGFFVDFFLYFLPQPEIEIYFYQLIYFVLGVSVSCFGAALAIHTNLGPGAKTQFYVAISERFHIKLWKSKMMMELLGLSIALIFTGPIALGTIIFAIISGPLIQYFLKIIKMLKIS